MKKQIKKDDVIELLLKKANGFYYTEEQFEFEKNTKCEKFKQIDMFDDINSEKNANYTKNISNNDIKIINNDDISAKKIKNNNINQKKNYISSNKKCRMQNEKKLVTVDSKNGDLGDNMELSNDISCDTFCDLALVKKKISRHYVPPDMSAIKLLFDIFEDKIEKNEIETMSDEELLKLKKQLWEELKNEDF